MTTRNHPGRLKQHHKGINAAIRLMDMALIIGLLLVFHEIRQLHRFESYLLLGLLMAICFASISSLTGLYRSHRLERRWSEISEILRNWAIAAAVLLTIGFMVKITDYYSRMLVSSWLVSTPLLLTVSRVLIRSIAVSLRSKGYNSRTGAIIGEGAMADLVKESIDFTPALGLRITDTYWPETHDPDTEDRLGALIKQATNGTLDHVYICMPPGQQEKVREIIDRFSDTTASIYLVPDSFTAELLQNRWTDLGNLSVISVHSTPFYGITGAVKRTEDILLAVIVLVLAAIPMIVIAAAVKLSSPGPIIYRQKRYGIGGQEIEVWKFRTMHICEKDAEFSQTTKNDPRVTGLGRFLRKTSLDELPQFFNVLQGHMSVIGPRPHAVKQNEEYRKRIKKYMIRHQVKPGISGWAQVNGWRGETEQINKMQRRIEHDLDYIENWSILLDLKIFFLSILRGFNDKNAV